MPNPNVEMEKLDDALDLLYLDLKEARIAGYPKSHLESILRQIREIEAILGLEPTPYNGK